MTIAERLDGTLTARTAPDAAAHEGWRVRTRGARTPETTHAMEDRS